MQTVFSRPNSQELPEPVRLQLGAIDPATLRGLVIKYAVPRVSGTRANRKVRDSLAHELSDVLNERAVVRIDEAENVIAGDPDSARVLIAAHYDSVPDTPGADDNASALAALLLAARAIGPDRGVGFIAFDGEESGFVGSRHFVARRKDTAPGVVHVLEMIGYASAAPGSQRNPIPSLDAPSIGNFLAVVANDSSNVSLRRVLAVANAHPLPVLGLALPNVPLDQIGRLSGHLLRSDHAPFWRAGQPALMWTDTAEFRNPHYHKPSDTPETLDYEFLAGVTRLLVHVALVTAR
jgi:Zn-dependent M28 family amino/carboxypeptidase